MKLVLILLLCCLAHSSFAQTYDIMINADFTYNKESAESIERGIKFVIDHGPYQSDGINFRVIRCDHRGVNSRSDLCVYKFIQNSNSLLMFTGLHSPPILANIFDSAEKYSINANKVLTLDPWAAAGAITRSRGDNWIFRLSIDDKYAGAFIADSVLGEGEKDIGIFYINGGWGEYNRKMISETLLKKGIKPKFIQMINRDISLGIAKINLEQAYKKGVKSIILIANASQGEVLFKAMTDLKLENKIKIRSHWGITGGGLIRAQYPLLKKIDLQVIQTKFSFASKDISPYGKKVLQKLIEVDPTISKASDIEAPVGFIHSHDLMLIVTKLMHDYKLNGPAKKVKVRLHQLLETDPVNVEGLVKFYKRPFRPISEDIDGHEALGVDDFRMFRVGSDMQWVPISSGK